ncbi:putative gulonolactone oxidase [Tripterygium wilfordii]|uniref:cytokinin dehydrogenase n=1 Tax=Tripterygium wilfordii TaxID=458696 RepID=A0A7J7DH58_TRIWF|nr:cytokinin dehydrogenase 3-like [Tripterygium wilfordii]KAF5745681.1 putative gulonolactone oxidase [Tripterygium wilfordii]
MAENFTSKTYLLILLFITRLVSITRKSKPWITLLRNEFLIKYIDISNRLHVDADSIKLASSDYGNIVHQTPAAVLRPSSVQDITNLVKFAYSSTVPVTIAARGHSHSIRGQAMARDGVVVDMMALRENVNESGVFVSGSVDSGFYADVGGEQLWVDVLHQTLKHGLAPVSWTDYLYLTVGGTLSNAGISGQTFRFGPQISNVNMMDVITGKGELVTCSGDASPELFYGVLGGLGQLGIITRARIALEPAPKRVKWVRMLYSDFTAFTKDQESLISINGRYQENALHYLEGSLLLHNQSHSNNWRSSFFPPSDTPKITSLMKEHCIIYCLELAKYYDDDATQHTVDQELQLLLDGLCFNPGFMFKRDVSYVDFLERVRSGELKLQSQGLWDVPHPWLNLFLPKSRISDFDSGVFKDIVMTRNITVGPILIYPMNRNKWDDRMSAAIPDEDVFYTVGFLHSSGIDSWEEFDEQNKEILKFCDNAGIDVKQYLPYYTTKEDWINHFGPKWATFQDRKAKFDPKMLLSPGQRIFN